MSGILGFSAKFVTIGDASTNETMLLVTDGTWTDSDGHTPQAGAVVARIVTNPSVPYTPDPGLSLVADDGRQKWTPPAPIPTEVASWQLALALEAIPSKIGASGSAFDDANAEVAKVGGAAAVVWARAAVITRASPLLNQLAPTIGFQPADIDALFVAAAGMVA